MLSSLKEQLVRSFSGRCRVEVADSGLDALELLEDLVGEGSDVPVLVADHIMPGMTGDELLRRVHQRWPRVRSILLTGQATADAVGRAVNEGNLYRYFTKPWDQRDLTLTIDRAVESYFHELELEAERETLQRIYLVALDLSANLAAESRLQRLLATARSALDAEGALLCSAWGRDIVCSEVDGFLDARPGSPLPTGMHDLMLEALSSTHPVRAGNTIAVALRFEDVVAGGLVLRVRHPERVPDGRVEAFAALAAAAQRTAALVDALENDADHRQQLAAALQRAANADIDGPLLGQSPKARELRDRIDQVARDDEDVVVIGPPGSGREAVARAVHRASERRDAAFIVVDCRMQRLTGTSCFERAEGSTRTTLELVHQGTLYLHNVESLDDAERARFAEYFRTRDERRLAAGFDPDVRIIASRKLVRGQALPVWPTHGTSIEVPGLRERVDDLEELSTHIVTKHAHRHGRAVLGLSAEAVRRLSEYAWPGNYNELVNVVERGVDTAKGTLLDADDVLLATAGTFGQYDLIRRIGQGGMGEVWLARHQLLLRDAAVKLIRPKLESTELYEMALRQFRQEAQATAKLRSPHTIELYDFGVTDDGTFYYAMELLHGMDLSTMVRTSGALPPERVVLFLKQACRSLIEAHGAGLVHRDIKPANLFVARLGAELDFIKLLDFGLVFAVDPGVSGKTNSLLGTPGYMAPEQVLGEFDQRTDLYALGCVAFRLLTGQPLFQGPTPVSTLAKQVKEAPRRPSSAAPNRIPTELDDVVMKCLMKDPNDRFQSAEELWRALSNVAFATPWTQDRAAAWWRERETRPVVPHPVSIPPAIPAEATVLPATLDEARPPETVPGLPGLET